MQKVRVNTNLIYDLLQSLVKIIQRVLLDCRLLCIARSALVFGVGEEIPLNVQVITM